MPFLEAGRREAGPLDGLDAIPHPVLESTLERPLPARKWFLGTFVVLKYRRDFRRGCNSSLDCRYGAREVGGGRSTRQPGQVRKEAALTSPDRVIVPASHLPVIRSCYSLSGLTARRGAGEIHS